MPPRPNLLTAAGRYDGKAIMDLAHSIARDDVADAAARGRTRRYKVALRDALTSAWITAKAQRDCAARDAELAAIPATHAAILAERTAALVGIDSGHVVGGEVGAMAGLFGSQALGSARAAGFRKIEDLIDRALLDPAFGRALAMKAPLRSQAAEGAMRFQFGRIGRSIALGLAAGQSASGKQGAAR